MEGLMAAARFTADEAEGNLGLLLLEEDAVRGLPELVSGVWEKMAQMLKKLADTLPIAASTLKFARREVSKLSSNLRSVFKTFDSRGRGVFDNSAGFWRRMWTLYFVLLVILQPCILYYAFWAKGYFGGPQPLTPKEEEAYLRPETFRESLAACLVTCSMCVKKSHDTQLCIWSVIVLFQAIALSVFIVSTVLCAFAGVQAFLVAGCADVYIINDDLICQEAMASLTNFLSSFWVEEALVPLKDSCDHFKLLTCQLIRRKMVNSTVLTTIFSLLAALLTFQMIIDSAILHEQARWRRIVARQQWFGDAHMAELPLTVGEFA